MARFEATRVLRFGDCDPAGIAYYPRYFDLLNGVVEDWWISMGVPLEGPVRRAAHRAADRALRGRFPGASLPRGRAPLHAPVKRIGSKSVELEHVVPARRDHPVAMRADLGRHLARHPSVDRLAGRSPRRPRFLPGGPACTPSCNLKAGPSRSATPTASPRAAGSCSSADRSAGTANASSRPTTSSARSGRRCRTSSQVLAEAGAEPQHLTSMTWYLTDKADYLANLKEIGQAYRDLIGRHYPGDGRGPGRRPDRGSRQGGDPGHRRRSGVDAGDRPSPTRCAARSATACLLIEIDHPPVNALVDRCPQRPAGGASRMARRRRTSSRWSSPAPATSSSAAPTSANSAAPPAEPVLPTVLAAIENAAKPVVAAINGAALGGGLEVALATHRRIAGPTATLALPEVKLGIVPGAGGTQRLPRLIGIPAAIDLIATGRIASASEALKLGIVDRIESGDLARGGHRGGAVAGRQRPAPHRRLRNAGGDSGGDRRRGQQGAGPRPRPECAAGSRAAGAAVGGACRSRTDWRRSAERSWRCAGRSRRRRCGMSSSPSGRRQRLPGSKT